MIQASTTKALTSGLPALAAKINNLHSQCEESYRNSLESARRAGELMLEAKSQLAHGQWLHWIEENTVISPRTAQVYMRLARNWHEFSSKYAEPAHLTIEAALKVLTPETEVVDGEFVEEKPEKEPARQLPPASQKPQLNSGSIADSASRSRSTQATVWPAAQADEFSSGVICRVINREQKDFYGRKVEILGMYGDNLAVFKDLDNGEKSCLSTKHLRPLQCSPNHYLHQILERVGLPHSLAITLLRQIVDQVDLPQELLDEASKFG